MIPPDGGGWVSADSKDGGPPALEAVPCDLCGSSDAVEVLTGRDFRYDLPGTFSVVRCTSCSLVRTSPRPVPTSLARYYPHQYSSHAALRPEHRSPVGEWWRRYIASGEGALHRTACHLYNSFAFRAFATTSTPGRVLDIGCGRGEYLAAWHRLGWQVEGVEPSRGAAAMARERCGGIIRTGFAEEVELPEAHYDLVTMVHCFEHVRSPRHMLKVVRTTLKPGGRVLLMVPNFDSVGRQLFGWRWYGMELPRHLFHFTPRTLNAVLESEGFSGIHIGGSAQPDVPLRSLLHLLGRPAHEARGPAVIRALGHAAMLPLSLLRRSTNLWAVAHKPSA